MRRPILLLALALAAVAGCYIGTNGDVLIVGRECTSDSDCDENTECVPADSPNANRVCMPFADGE